MLEIGEGSNANRAQLALWSLPIARSGSIQSFGAEAWRVLLFLDGTLCLFVSYRTATWEASEGHLRAVSKLPSMFRVDSSGSEHGMRKGLTGVREDF